MGREEWSKNKNTSHSRESGNLPTSAPTARILSGSGAGRALPVLPQPTGDSRFRGNGGIFFCYFFCFLPCSRTPPFPHSPHFPIPPPFPFPRKRESPDSSATGANHKQEWRILPPLTIPPHYPPLILPPSFSPSHSPPPFFYSPHSRESGNLPTPAPPARIKFAPTPKINL